MQDFQFHLVDIFLNFIPIKDLMAVTYFRTEFLSLGSNGYFGKISICLRNPGKLFSKYFLPVSEVHGLYCSMKTGDKISILERSHFRAEYQYRFKQYCNTNVTQNSVVLQGDTASFLPLTSELNRHLAEPQHYGIRQFLVYVNKF